MAGILATVVSRETPLVLMWFRAEYVQTINWAGNPHKPVEPGTNLGTLTPGQCKPYEASYTPTEANSTEPGEALFTDCVRTIGSSALFGDAENSDSAECPLCPPTT